MLFGCGATRMRSSTKMTCVSCSLPIGMPFCCSSHCLARGFRSQLRVLTNSIPDSGAPCFAPHLSWIGCCVVTPYTWGCMCVPTSSLARFILTGVSRSESSIMRRMALCFILSNAFDRSNLNIVRGCSHSCASSVSFCSVKMASAGWRDLRKPY